MYCMLLLAVEEMRLPSSLSLCFFFPSVLVVCSYHYFDNARLQIQKERNVNFTLVSSKLNLNWRWPAAVLEQWNVHLQWYCSASMCCERWRQRGGNDENRVEPWKLSVPSGLPPYVYSPSCHLAQKISLEKKFMNVTMPYGYTGSFSRLPS